VTDTPTEDYERPSGLLRVGFSGHLLVMSPNMFHVLWLTLVVLLAWPNVAAALKIGRSMDNMRDILDGSRK